MLSGTIMAMGLILHHINVILAYFQFGYVLETSMRPFVLAQSIFGILIPVVKTTTPTRAEPVQFCCKVSGLGLGSSG